MYWGKNRLKAHLVMAAILLAGTSAAAADILVVRSTGPSAKAYPPGKSLAADARITLKANDTLVLLDGKGTRTLRGPGTFTPSGPARASQTSALAALTSGSQPRRARIGAVRSVGIGEPRAPTIWHVDVSKSGTLCIVDPANVMLWRSDATKPVAMTITRTDNGATQELDWQAGQAVAAWPSGLTIDTGADYKLSWAGASTPTTIHFKTLGAAPGGLEDVASSFIQNGCQDQLNLLIETVRAPDDTPPAG